MDVYQVLTVANTTVLCVAGAKWAKNVLDRISIEPQSVAGVDYGIVVFWWNKPASFASTREGVGILHFEWLTRDRALAELKKSSLEDKNQLEKERQAERDFVCEDVADDSYAWLLARVEVER